MTAVVFGQSKAGVFVTPATLLLLLQLKFHSFILSLLKPRCYQAKLTSYINKSQPTFVFHCSLTSIMKVVTSASYIFDFVCLLFVFYEQKAKFVAVFTDISRWSLGFMVSLAMWVGVDLSLLLLHSETTFSQGSDHEANFRSTSCRRFRDAENYYVLGSEAI